MHYYAWLTMNSFEYIQTEQYNKSISSGFRHCQCMGDLILSSYLAIGSPQVDYFK